MTNFGSTRRGMALLALMMMGLLTACGSGGGDEGSSPQAVVSVASEGPIDGFGSVIMNGVRWNTDEAVFEIEGRVGKQDDLAVGMSVRIEGQRGPDGTARADRVIYESNLRGPVRSIVEVGPDTRILEIFGLSVVVSRSSTQFEGTDLEGLAVDTVVDLSGFVNGEDELEASHLRVRGRPIENVTEVKLFGRVSGLAGGSFLIGTSEVRFDESTLVDDFGSAGLRDGLAVRVEGILQANDAVEAREIEAPRRRNEDQYGEVEIYGIVADFVSLADFRVAGRSVNAERATLEPNDPLLLRDGARVEVEGYVDAAGVLQAEKLKFRSNRVRIHAEIAGEEDIEAAEGRLWLLGIPIEFEGETELRDQRDDLEDFGLADLRAGDFVQVRGLARSDGSVIATRLRREDHDDLRIRGPVDLIDEVGQYFTILGVPIPTGSGTVFKAEDGTLLTESEFYGLIGPGVVVQAEDEEDGDETDFDFANEVELEEKVLIDPSADPTTADPGAADPATTDPALDDSSTGDVVS